MAAIAWTTPTTRSSNILSTVADSLANGSESATITVDNSTEKKPYCLVTLQLGSITPSTGGSVTLRVTFSDGTATGDKVGGEVYVIPLTSGASAKTNILRFGVPPLSLRFSIVNNSGVSLAASGNALYYRLFSEETV